jgi:quercetin dioxygenase-like cupin family protein
MRVVTPGEWGPDLGLVTGGTWKQIVGGKPGGTPGRSRSLHAIELGQGSETRVLSHPVEAVYYVAEGRAIIVEALVGAETPASKVDEGSMVHVAPGSAYRFASDSGARLIGGPCPVDPNLGDQVGQPSRNPGIRLFHRDRPGLQVPFISADARLVVWLGSRAVTANMNYVVLEPGERNREHVHAYSEDTIHILEGHGTAENVSTQESFRFGPGDTIQIDVGTWHAIAADLGERVVSVGGPCPADVDMLRAAGVDVDAITADLPGPLPFPRAATSENA